MILDWWFCQKEPVFRGMDGKSRNLKRILWNWKEEDIREKRSQFIFMKSVKQKSIFCRSLSQTWTWLIQYIKISSQKIIFISLFVWYGILTLSSVQGVQMTYCSMIPGNGSDCCQTDLHLNPDFQGALPN